MSATALVVGLSLGAALSFAVSTALKHLSAQRVPQLDAAGGGAFGRFLVATLRHPLWLAGALFDVAGLVLQVFALHLGTLALVQPLLLTGLVFSLLLRSRAKIGRKEFGWALLVCCSLATLLAFSGSTSGTVSAEPPDRLPALISATSGLIIVVTAFTAGRRRRTATYGAALLGVAIGTTYAATAALLKALADIAVHAPLAMIWSWQLYAVIIAGTAGLLITQLAFQSGPLTASLPAAATVDPLVSIVIGVLIFDEHLNTGIGRGAGLLLLLLVLFLAVARLTQLGDREALPQLDIANPLQRSSPAPRPTNSNSSPRTAWSSPSRPQPADEPITAGPNGVELPAREGQSRRPRTPVSVAGHISVGSLLDLPDQVRLVCPTRRRSHRIQPSDSTRARHDEQPDGQVPLGRRRGIAVLSTSSPRDAPLHSDAVSSPSCRRRCDATIGSAR